MTLLIRINYKNQKTINWLNAQNRLFKIQHRIVSQLEKKNFRNVRNLQRLLLKSLSAKLITSQNILKLEYSKDFTLYQVSNKQRFPQLLNLTNYIQFDPNIELKGDKKYFNFLKILWILALIPIHETYSNSFYYNFRLYRDHTDFLKGFLINLKSSSNNNWLLIIKPNGFLNRKNKRWLIQNLLIEKKFLFNFFRQIKFANNFAKEYKYNQEFLETKKISFQKIIKNFSLHGFTLFQKNNFSKSNHISIIFYNNLILVPSPSSNHIILLYRYIFKFLKNRGLSIKKNRIWVLNLKKGFNFLGFFFKKQKNNNINITISRQNIQSHKIELKKFLKLNRALSIDKVIYRLNRKIYNWQLYYSYASNLKKTWSEMNYYLFWRIWQWSKKKHKNKGSKWIYQRYWSRKKDSKWVFHFNNQYLRSYNFKKQKIIHLQASINACKLKNVKNIQQICLQKYNNFV